jgi:putative transposase
MVKLAYRFALDPTAAQTRALRSHAGAARFAWNWALARCKERYAAERKWYSGTACTGCGTRPRKPTRPWAGGRRTPNKDSFRLTGTIRCTGNSVTLPRLGTIATCESTGKLAGRIAGGCARILSATVTRTAGRWFVSLTVEEDRPVPASGPTACTRPRRCSPPGTRPWSSRT